MTKFKTVEEATAHLQGLIDNSPFKGLVKVVPCEFTQEFFVYEVVRLTSFWNRRAAYIRVWFQILVEIHSAHVETPK